MNDDLQVLVLETPNEFKEYIITNGLDNVDSDFMLSVIIDKLLEYSVQYLYDTESTTDIPVECLTDISKTLIQELGYYKNEPKDKIIKRFEDTEYITNLNKYIETILLKFLSIIVGYNLQDRFIYCKYCDINKIVIEHRKKDSNWFF